MAIPLRALQAIGEAKAPNRPLADAASKQNVSRPATAVSRKEQQRYDEACRAYGVPASRPTTAASSHPPPPASRVELSTLLMSFGVGKRHEAQPAVSRTAIETIHDDHESMMAVLSTRQLRIRAARTMLKMGDDALVEHLTKVDDVSLAADVLPFESWRLDRSKSELSQAGCAEMLRLVHSLLTSAYERYNTVGLLVLDAVLRRWSGELSRVGRPQTAEGLLASISLHRVREGVRELNDVVSSLTCKDGQVGKEAARIHRTIDKL